MNWVAALGLLIQIGSIIATAVQKKQSQDEARAAIAAQMQADILARVQAAQAAAKGVKDDPTDPSVWHDDHPRP